MNAHKTAELDCRRCGACCFARSGTIWVIPADLIRWRREERAELVAAVEPGHFGQPAVPMRQGHCAYQGTSESAVDCSIYPTRPETCRRFEAGSRQCHEARRERGIE